MPSLNTTTKSGVSLRAGIPGSRMATAKEVRELSVEHGKKVATARHAELAFLSGTRRGRGGAFAEHVHTGQPAWRAGGRKTVYFPNDDEYRGEWQRDLREGVGTQQYANGEMYEGEWRVDFREGQGKLWIPAERDGDAGEGTSGAEAETRSEASSTAARATATLGEDQRPSSGTRRRQRETPANGIPQRFRRTKDGRVLRLSYDGGWRADLKHGLGVLYMANGDVYEGEWEAGARSGWGVCLYASGERYEGEWVAGLREGQGKYFYANGNIHEGMWAADMKDGPGKLYYAARSQLYEGEWFEDAVRCGVVVDLEPEDPSRIDLPLVGIANETMVSLLQERIDEVKEARLDRAEAAATARSDAMRTAAETRRIQEAEDNRIGGRNLQRSTRRRKRAPFR